MSALIAAPVDTEMECNSYIFFFQISTLVKSFLNYIGSCLIIAFNVAVKSNTSSGYKIINNLCVPASQAQKNPLTHSWQKCKSGVN